MAKEAAKAYDEVQLYFQGRNGIDLIDRLDVKKGSVILDLGCGTGYLSSILAERVGQDGRVIGVDPNTNRLELAKNKYSKINNLQFTSGSNETFPSGPYDIIFSAHVMHWIKDKESTFKMIYDNLKPEGKFVLMCAVGSKINPVWKLLNPHISESLYLWKYEHYEQLALQCGFEIESKAVNIERYSFESPKHYIEWCLATMNLDTADSNTLNSAKRIISQPHLDWKKAEYTLMRIH